MSDHCLLYKVGFEAGKKAALQWQPIETAPKDGTVVLLYGELRAYTSYASKHVFMGQYVPRFTEECGEEEYDAGRYEFKEGDEEGTPYSLQGWVEKFYNHCYYSGSSIDLEKNKLLGWLPLSVLPPAPEVSE